MLEQLLKDPAFAALYKNAPQLNNIEVPKLELGAFVLPQMPVIPPVVQTPTILPTVTNSPVAKKRKVSWIVPVVILVGGIYAFYKITRWIEEENEKSKN
jgi:hypothetical protein